MTSPSPAESMEERFLLAFLETARKLQDGPDPEVILEALIAASRLLTSRLEGELQELRQEQTD
jgi:hypothetical protein